MKVININSLSVFKLLNENKNFRLIDVRTEREWLESVPFVNNIILLSLRLYPNMVINKDFCQTILGLKNSLGNETSLFFLCKSGARSFEAANIIAEHDIANCYNIIDGFEGNGWGKGWKANNLPYTTNIQYVSEHSIYMNNKVDSMELNALMK